MTTVHNPGPASATPLPPATSPSPHHPVVDFGDTRIAFAHKNAGDLSRTRRLFALMNQPTLVRLGSVIGSFAVRWRLPFAERATLGTIYRQFVGGRTLLEAQGVAEELGRLQVLSVLDFGAEGKEDEKAHNHTMTECIRAIEFAARDRCIPVVSTKLSGLTSNDCLTELSKGTELTPVLAEAHSALLKRVDSMCHVASTNDVQLYIDAEESWMQPAIDEIVMVSMLRYNKARATVVNTYQMYRHDRLAALVAHHATCREHGVVFGAKLVRGAYMNKERTRAEMLGYPSPIQVDKASTDVDFDRAVDYCLDHIDSVEFVNASHNQASAEHMIRGMASRSIPVDHPSLMFCQLYGMSDNMTFNLAAAGYRVGKYLPYGPVEDVVPYLVRRAQENTSITGEASRELRMIDREIARRAEPGR